MSSYQSTILVIVYSALKGHIKRVLGVSPNKSACLSDKMRILQNKKHDKYRILLSDKYRVQISDKCRVKMDKKTELHDECRMKLRHVI
ncbi:hypothetical protein M2145_002544 [Lachnospiraceae bacterium PF1-21]